MIIKEKKFIYGGDYYPEQWIEHPEILEKDIMFLKNAKMNLVSIGVFSWSELEPEEGKFQIDWLEKIINQLYENGISVMLATPSGAKPRWIAKKYPEVLRVRENRVRELYGERHNHCFSSKVYREKTRIINAKLASRFKNNPAVVMWHISNEYGGSCHCPLCQREFQQWLEERYKTIENLNHAWWTRFWSHQYTSFDEIESPSSIGEKSVHGLNLDWKRFVSDQTIDFMKEEIAALREQGAMQPVTTNMMYDFQGINYGKMKDFVDVISWDTYPLWHKKEDIEIAYDTGMQHDYMRSLKKQPFLLMESCPSSTNWQGVSKLKKPGTLLNASLQTIAHGGDSVQYFQIRQSRGSFEKFHGAVIDQYGEEDTRVYQEVKEVGEVLEDIASIAGTDTKAPAALLYDVENRWALEDAQGPRNKGLFYHETAMKSYRALKKCGLNVDVIDMDQSLDHYRLVVAPMLYLFRSNIENRLLEFVKQGGTLIMTYWSGVVNETDLCYLGGTPHGLLEVLGLRMEEIDGLYDEEENQSVPVKNNSLGMQNTYTCKNLCELVRVQDAESLMVYGSDFYQGKSVLTNHRYGSGESYYIAADMERDFYTDFYKKVCKKINLKGMFEEIPDGIEVCSRSSETQEYFFIQNYTNQKIPMYLSEDIKILSGEYLKGYIPARSTIIGSRKNQEK